MIFTLVLHIFLLCVENAVTRMSRTGICCVIFSVDKYSARHHASREMSSSSAISK